MNREQKINALVLSGMESAYEVESHQWLGIIRSLLNIIFSSMDDEELNGVYEDVIGPDRPKAG